ncbi:MAG: PTS sugar transporter subunit IIA [Chitinispirillaceae bacterium]|nr:PTS sugar transporter subunit IIA [Chitinispirillaceae bacterium]
MMINVKDVARLLSVSEKKVYRLIAQNSVPYYKIGEEYQFNRVELLEWATMMGIKVSTETFKENNDSYLSTSVFLDALKDGSITYDVSGTDRESVLRNVVKTFKLPVDFDPEFLLEILLAREKMGSTGIGEGIAIPHIRYPLILNGSKPAISLCFLKQPVEFNAADGIPVSILFTIISPTVKVHLQLLSHLSYSLQNAAFKAAVQSKASRETLLEILQKAQRVISS